MAVIKKTSQYKGHWTAEASEVWSNIEANLTIPDVRDSCHGSKVHFELIFKPGGGAGFDINEYRLIQMISISNVERNRSTTIATPYTPWSYDKIAVKGSWKTTNDSLTFQWSRPISCVRLTQYELEFYVDLPPSFSSAWGFTSSTTIYRVRATFNVETDAVNVTASTGDIIDFTQATKIMDPVNRTTVARKVNLP